MCYGYKVCGTFPISYATDELFRLIKLFLIREEALTPPPTNRLCIFLEYLKTKGHAHGIIYLKIFPECNDMQIELCGFLCGRPLIWSSAKHLNILSSLLCNLREPRTPRWMQTFCELGIRNPWSWSYLYFVLSCTAVITSNTCLKNKHSSLERTHLPENETRQHKMISWEPCQPTEVMKVVEYQQLSRVITRS